MECSSPTSTPMNMYMATWGYALFCFVLSVFSVCVCKELIEWDVVFPRATVCHLFPVQAVGDGDLYECVTDDVAVYSNV